MFNSGFAESAPHILLSSNSSVVSTNEANTTDFPGLIEDSDEEDEADDNEVDDLKVKNYVIPVESVENADGVDIATFIPSQDASAIQASPSAPENGGSADIDMDVMHTETVDNDDRAIASKPMQPSNLLREKSTPKLGEA